MIQHDFGRPPSLRPSATARRGASLVLIVFMLFTFVVTAAITIDYAHMQLVQTELRVATDAAAKAGAEALSRDASPKEAIAEAVRYAKLNTVAGDPLLIRSDDVTVGRLTAGAGGRWDFAAGQSPPNAIRVHGRTGDTALHPAIPLFFGQILGRTHFAPHHQATAGQQEVEVCLCLDRSGSMLFDMSGEEYSYAPDNPALSDFTDWGPTWQNHLSPPHPTASRWAVLASAVELFLDEASKQNPPPRVSLVTWGSDYQMPISPYTQFHAATADVPLPPSLSQPWKLNRKAIEKAVEDLGDQPMMGGTNLSAGLDTAVSTLVDSSLNHRADKIVILLTDGMWNDGRHPSEAAADASDADIVVHTVTMLTAHQADVEQVSQMTGGRYFNASNAEELRAAFEELARSLPVALVD